VLPHATVPGNQRGIALTIEHRFHGFEFFAAHGGNADLDPANADAQELVENGELRRFGEGDAGRLLAIAQGCVLKNDVGSDHGGLPSAAKVNAPLTQGSGAEGQELMRASPLAKSKFSHWQASASHSGSCVRAAPVCAHSSIAPARLVRSIWVRDGAREI